MNGCASSISPSKPPADACPSWRVRPPTTRAKRSPRQKKFLRGRAWITFLPPRLTTTSPRRKESYQHFSAIAEASTKPLILYNIAGRTGTNIETSTLLRLAENPNIIAVKEASGNIAQIAEVCASVPEDFLVFSGDDAITLAVIGLGGVGIVSVASNEIPAEMSRMTNAALVNKWDEARLLLRKYLPLMQGNFIESSPGPVKAVLAMMGRIEEIYRLPLVPVKKETRAKLEKIAAEIGLLQSQPAASR